MRRERLFICRCSADTQRIYRLLCSLGHHRNTESRFALENAALNNFVDTLEFEEFQSARSISFSIFCMEFFRSDR